MPTLHSNNPVPSNGSVATVIRGAKSISMTLSGVGAVRAVVQIMAKEDGAAPGPIGNQIVVSGTTTVTTTQTFNADAGQVYLQLIDITPNCKFSATLTDLGPIQDTNPGSLTNPFPTEAARNAAYASQLPGAVGWPAYLPGGVLTTWVGPTNADWNVSGLRQEQSAIAAYRPFQMGVVTTGTTNKSYALSFSAKFNDPIGMRWVFENYTGSDIVVPVAKILLTASRYSNGPGDTEIPLAVNGNGTITIPARVSGSALPNIVPGVVKTDAIYFIPRARSDGGVNPSFQCRVYINTTHAFNVDDNTIANQLQAISGDEYAGASSDGDTVTTLTSMGVWKNPPWIGYPEFIYQKRVMTLASVGDSIPTGYGATANIAGMALRATAIARSKGRRASSFVQSLAGQNHSTSYETGIKILQGDYRPTAMLIFGWSPNDGTTDAVFSKELAEALRLAEACIRYNVRPLLVTAAPNGNASVSQLTTHNAKIAASGYDYCDIYSILVDPNNPGKILPAYSAGDGVHINDAGQAAAASAIADRLYR